MLIFVIVEGNVRIQKTNFNKDNFNKFKNKIIYIPVTDMPDGDNPYIKGKFQRNCISRGLKNANEDDLIIISDLDEIPNPEKINNFKNNMKYAVFKQMHFYYKFNLRSEKSILVWKQNMCKKIFEFTSMVKPTQI